MTTGCNTCNIKFEEKEDLLEHLKVNHEEGGMDLTASQRVLLLPSPSFVMDMELNSDEETPKKKASSEENTPKNTKTDKNQFKHKEDLDQTITEQEEEVPKRQAKYKERYYVCDICKSQTNNYEEHDKHRKTKHKLGKGMLPPNGAPIQIKRKLVALSTVKYECEMCNFSTKNKNYLPQHVKKIHGKVTKPTEISKHKLTRSTSVISSSSVTSPPTKTRKVTDNTNTREEVVVNKKSNKDDEGESITEEEVNLCFQKLLRGKSIKEAATNTEKEEDENKLKPTIAYLEKRIKEQENILKSSSEVIQNLEEENNDLHKKVNYLGNNADLVEDLLREVAKRKKESNDNTQSCLLCDETNVTMHELRYHIRKIHDVEEEVEDEKDDTIRDWLKQLNDVEGTQNDDDNKEMKIQLTKLDQELKQLNEIVVNKDEGLKMYEYTIKQAEIKYNQDEKKIKALTTENEELHNNVKLLKIAVKVVESKLTEKENDNEEEEMEQDVFDVESLRLVQLKNSGFHRTSPQSNVGRKSPEPSPALPGSFGPGTTFSCHICKQGGIPAMAVAAHLKSHREEGAFKCDDCSFQANNIGVLKNHADIVKHSYTVQVQDFICEICGTECETKKELIEHNNVHKLINDLTCKICAREVTSKNQLRNHMRKEHRTLREDWQEIDSEEIPLEASHNQIIRIANIKCKFCEEQFSTNNEMWEHRKQDHPSHKPCINFPNCDFAGRCAYSHIQIPEGMVRCFECGKDFKSYKEMMIHRKSVHNDGTVCRKFIQNQCNRPSNQCWFSHEISNQAQTNQISQNRQTQDFQPRTQTQLPPGNQTQNLNNQLKSILPEVMNQMLPQILMKILQNIQQN